MADVRRGRIARDAGRWTDAEAAFKSALAFAQRAQTTEALRAEIVGELGLVELRLSKYRDAAEHLAEALALGGASLNAVLARRFEEGQRNAEKHVSRVYLSVIPADAEVLVDGKIVTKREAAHELFLDPGPHTIRARMAGYGDFATSFQSSAGDSRRVRAELPGAKALPVVALPSAGGSRAAQEPAETASGAGATWRTVGIIVTATTAAAGTTALALSAAQKDAVDEAGAELRHRSGPAACVGAGAPSACAALDEGERRRVALAWIGTGSLIASGVVGAMTLVSFGVSSQGPDRSSGLHITPIAGEQHAGLLIHGFW